MPFASAHPQEVERHLVLAAFQPPLVRGTDIPVVIKRSNASECVRWESLRGRTLLAGLRTFQRLDLAQQFVAVFGV